MSALGGFLRRIPPLRRRGKADVTICIPAFEAAGFIERTLRFAQGQTYRNIEILVSVDYSSDRTAEICRSFAALDSRMKVIEHGARLGWCANVNALLERVETPFFFIYFHDDIILPQYCERLRGALLSNPQAASANCDLLDFGLHGRLAPGRSYEGSVAKRILTLWGVPERGTPLRSMVRRDRVGSDFRLPAEEQDSITPGQTFLLLMVAAGPAIHVPEVLYLRWNRKGGLVDSWSRMPFEKVIDGWRKDLRRVFLMIDQKVSDPEDRKVLKFAQTLYVLRHLAGSCRAHGRPLPKAAELHCDARASDVPPAVDRFGSEIAQWLQLQHAEVTRLRAELERC
jgi:glycosyltransferase involved in cell wall biosynthesis